MICSTNVLVRQCPGGTFTPAVRSSKNFSDEAVNFIRAHPLMFHPVYPVHRRPLVVRTGVDYRFTALVVDQVDAVDGRYEVLFLGTGETPAGPPGINVCSRSECDPSQIEEPSRRSSCCPKTRPARRS